MSNTVSCPLFRVGDLVRTSTAYARHEWKVTAPAKVGEVIKLKRRYALVKFEGSEELVWFSLVTGHERNGDRQIGRTNPEDIAQVREREAEATKAHKEQQSKRSHNNLVDDARKAEHLRRFRSLSAEDIGFVPLTYQVVGDAAVMSFSATPLTNYSLRPTEGPYIFTLVITPSKELDWGATSEKRQAMKAEGTYDPEDESEPWHVYLEGWAISFSCLSPTDRTSSTLRFAPSLADAFFSLIGDEFAVKPLAEEVGMAYEK